MQDVSSPPGRGRRLSLVWPTLIALGLLIAMTTALLVLQLRRSAMLDAARELRSLAVVLANQVERAFEAVDLAQTTFLESLHTELNQSPEAFRQSVAGTDIYDRLTSQGRLLPQLDALALVDADGNFINISRRWPVPKVNIADREHFRALRADPGLDRAVSEAFESRVTGTPVMVVSRPLRNPQGEFLGISFVGLQMSYFENLYRTVVGQSDLAIALTRADGMLLARYPHAPDGIGHAFGGDGVFRRMAESGQDNVVTRLVSRIDGFDRLIAGQALAHFPLVVTVSATVPSILRPWREQALYLIAAAVLLEFGVAGLGLLMRRQLRDQRMLTEARAARSEAEAAVALADERERAGREMRVQNLRFGAALGNMSQALCMFDADGALVVANRRASEMFGLPPGEVSPGMTVGAMRELLRQKSNLPAADIEALYGGIMRLQAGGRRAARIRELGDGRSLAVNFAPVEDGGWLMTLEDVTERRQVEARITHMANHDAVTGLPNRVMFHERLGEAVVRSRAGEVCAVLFLDLDHFKSVNDTLGHPIGDSLLRAVTARLVRQVGETGTVARLGGDEFAILLGRIDEAADATALALRIIDVVGAPYQIDGHRVIIGTSVGIAIAPDHGEDADQILKNADMALYRAKANGRGRYRLFEPAMDAVMQARRMLELDLHRGLAEGEFEVFYQPQINLASRTLSGFEALVRWRHPQRGMVPPSEFIPLAEEIGLIVPLGEWVLRQACRDAAGWPGQPKVAVNLSSVQFGNPTLVEDVAAALSDAGLAPDRLELELTETAMVADTDGVLAILLRLRALGVGIAMDDFGTGYSSLSYLRRFPFTKVKIDRSFIEGIGRGGDSDAIVDAVTALCNTLGMATTAEGVETVEQLERLAASHCTEVQGYLFSRPRPAGEVAAMCRTLGGREVEKALS